MSFDHQRHAEGGGGRQAQRGEHARRHRLVLGVVGDQDGRKLAGSEGLAELGELGLGRPGQRDDLIELLRAVEGGAGDQPHRAEVRLVALQVERIRRHVLDEVRQARTEPLLDAEMPAEPQRHLAKEKVLIHPADPATAYHSQLRNLAVEV
jgi:hypothetical protein